jgi:hypothetical protein
MRMDKTSINVLFKKGDLIELAEKAEETIEE